MTGFGKRYIVHTFNFEYLKINKTTIMVYRVAILEDIGIKVLQLLNVSYLSNISNRFYESPKLKNWMCELCTFSQIWSSIKKANKQAFTKVSLAKRF